MAHEPLARRGIQARCGGHAEKRQAREVQGNIRTVHLSHPMVLLTWALVKPYGLLTMYSSRRYHTQRYGGRTCPKSICPEQGARGMEGFKAAIKAPRPPGPGASLPRGIQRISSTGPGPTRLNPIYCPASNPDGILAILASLPVHIIGRGNTAV